MLEHWPGREPVGEQLAGAETRERIERQAAAEEAQGRRMERLVEEGAKLVQEAMKNKEFEPQTLEKLAEDIQTLGDIAEERMPSVADLLKQAANAKMASAKNGKPDANTLAQNSGKPGEGKPGEGQSGAQSPQGAEGSKGSGQQGDKPNDQSSPQSPDGQPAGESAKDDVKRVD